jgi:phosphohistidine swiveling domain-containing protein
MEQLNEWQKIVARTEDVLHWDACVSFRREGMKLGALTWGTKNDLILKNNVPLGIWYDKNPAVAEQTNLGEFLDGTRNVELDEALDGAIHTIDQDLGAIPGSTRQDAEALYHRFRTDMGLMVFGLICNAVPVARLREILGEKMTPALEEQLLRPYRPTVIGRESRAIYEVQKEMGQHDAVWLEERAEQLAREFGYIHSEYISSSWTKEDYRQALQGEVLVIDEVEDLDETRFSEYERWLISVVQKLSYLHDEGKSALVRTNWALRGTLRQLGLNDTMLHLNEQEFLVLTKTGSIPSDDALKEREQYYAILSQGERYEFFFGQEVVESLAVVEGLAKQEVAQVAVLKGSIAFKGTVTGIARIILTQEDSKRLEEGEIMVASMTTPAYIDAMRRAAAFVTDEGGIICHAAIVAREFKKPCIVGTKNATEMIKDGDKIEVDAESGIVRII